MKLFTFARVFMKCKGRAASVCAPLFSPESVYGETSYSGTAIGFDAMFLWMCLTLAGNYSFVRGSAKSASKASRGLTDLLD